MLYIQTTNSTHDAGVSVFEGAVSPLDSLLPGLEQGDEGEHEHVRGHRLKVPAALQVPAENINILFFSRPMSLSEQSVFILGTVRYILYFVRSKCFMSNIYIFSNQNSWMYGIGG